MPLRSVGFIIGSASAASAFLLPADDSGRLALALHSRVPSSHDPNTPRPARLSSGRARGQAGGRMKVHLVDGTYELFRAHYGAPPATGLDGAAAGASRGLMRTLLALLASPGVTHVACAYDHVIESFRNDLYDGYKTSEGVPPELLAQ